VALIFLLHFLHQGKKWKTPKPVRNCINRQHHTSKKSIYIYASFMSNRLRIPFYFAICTSLLFSLLATPVAASGYPTNDTSWHTNSAYDITSTVWSDTPTTVIPFTMAGNLIIIKAKADTIEGNFILDTGAPHLVLNITYFRDYKIIQETNEIQTATTGAGASVSRTQIRQFSIGSIHHRKIDADLTNLGHIENIRGIRILGLIGIDLLKQCEMIIDYERSLIYLHHISRKEATGYKSVHLKEHPTPQFLLTSKKIRSLCIQNWKGRNCAL
jgi:hypothetical protein